MTIPPDSRLRAAYAARAADAPLTPHPAPEAIAATVDRSAGEAERLATLDHIAACAQCRSEFELLRATHTAAGQLAPATWRISGVGLAVAAMLVVAVALSVTRLAAPRVAAIPADRGAGQASSRTIPLIAPLGPTSVVPQRLIWHAVRGAAGYHVEVLTDSGGVIARGDTRDTTFTAPALAPGQTYRWWVQARVDGEAWQSGFAEIRVRP